MKPFEGTIFQPIQATICSLLFDKSLCYTTIDRTSIFSKIISTVSIWTVANFL